MNSPEYRTFMALTSDLNLAVRSNLISLGGALVACGLISPNDYDDLRNPMHSEATRAANLTALVSRKIQEASSNYHTFVSVLKQDYVQYNHILSKLNHKYAVECQQNNQLGMFVAASNLLAC